MSAYWICIYKAVHDQDQVMAYAELAGPAIAAGGGRFLARGNPEATFEQAEVTLSLGKGAVTTARKAVLDVRTSALATFTTGRHEAAHVAEIVIDTVAEDAEVAATVRAEPGHAPALERDARPGLRAGRDRDPDLAVLVVGVGEVGLERLHGHLRAEGRSGHRDPYGDLEVVALAAEHLVLGHVELDIEVAGRAAARADLAAPADPTESTGSTGSTEEPS